MSSKQTSSKSGAGSRTEQVRSAVDQAFQAAGSQLTRERAQEIADELTGAAQRVREALEDLRPPSPDVVRGLEERVAALEARIAALEKKPAARKPAARKPAAKKPAAAKATPPADPQA